MPAAPALTQKPMASPFFQKLHLHELAKALMQFFGLTENVAIGFDANGKLKNIEGLGETVTEAELALTDVTTANASTTKHGFLKKLSNAAGEVMTGTGSWATIATILGYTPADAAAGAGGVLSGNYPNPGFAVNMATQAELDAVAGTVPTKATGAEVNTGTDNDKFVTAAALAASHLGDLITAPAAFIADPTGAATDQDDEARAAIAAILDLLVAKGIMAAS